MSTWDAGSALLYGLVGVWLSAWGMAHLWALARRVVGLS